MAETVTFADTKGIEKKVICPRTRTKLVAQELVQHLKKAQDEKKSASVYITQRCDEVTTTPCKKPIFFNFTFHYIDSWQGRAEVWVGLVQTNQSGAFCTLYAQLPPWLKGQRTKRSHSWAGKWRAKWVELGGKTCICLRNKIQKLLRERNGGALNEWMQD